MDEPKQIGWIEREEGYYKLYEPKKGSIVTRALIFCKYCKESISGSNGPRHDAVCLKCFDLDKRSLRIK